jgi:hypothetical protein
LCFFSTFYSFIVGDVFQLCNDPFCDFDPNFPLQRPDSLAPEDESSTAFPNYAIGMCFATVVVRLAAVFFFTHFVLFKTLGILIALIALVICAPICFCIIKRMQ